MRVLLAEDDEAARIVISTIVRSAGHEVELAQDGFEALEKARALPPDVLLTDILMPRMDGYRLILAWKQDPVLCQVPVVVLSASYTDSEDIHLAKDLGAETFLLKPVVPEELLEALKTAPALGRPEAPRAPVVTGREEALDRYSGRLMSKLEQKVLALEEANARLEATVGVLSDEVEVKRRLIQALARADQAKANFIAIVSHELRTPLAEVSGYAQLLMKPNLPEASRGSAAGAIERGVARLSRLLDEMITVLDIESEALPVSPQPMALSDMLREAAQAVGVDGRHEVRLRIPRRLPKVLADDLRIRVVIDQLLDNALKFSPEGGVIEIGAKAVGDEVSIWVTDEGVGIESAELERIFEAFHQADMSDARRFEGLGMGLYLVRRIVTAHGGRVEVESTPGEGSTFTVFIPRDRR